MPEHYLGNLTYVRGAIKHPDAISLAYMFYSLYLPLDFAVSGLWRGTYPHVIGGRTVSPAALHAMAG